MPRLFRAFSRLHLVDFSVVFSFQFDFYFEIKCVQSRARISSNLKLYLLSFLFPEKNASFRFGFMQPLQPFLFFFRSPLLHNTTFSFRFDIESVQYRKLYFRRFRLIFSPLKQKGCEIVAPSTFIKFFATLLLPNVRNIFAGRRHAGKM